MTGTITRSAATGLLANVRTSLTFGVPAGVKVLAISPAKAHHVTVTKVGQRFTKFRAVVHSTAQGECWVFARNDGWALIVPVADVVVG